MAPRPGAWLAVSSTARAPDRPRRHAGPLRPLTETHPSFSHHHLPPALSGGRWREPVVGVSDWRANARRGRGAACRLVSWKGRIASARVGFLALVAWTECRRGGRDAGDKETSTLRRFVGRRRVPPMSLSVAAQLEPPLPKFLFYPGHTNRCPFGKAIGKSKVGRGGAPPDRVGRCSCRRRRSSLPAALLLSTTPSSPARHSHPHRRAGTTAMLNGRGAYRFRRLACEIRPRIGHRAPASHGVARVHGNIQPCSHC